MSNDLFGDAIEPRSVPQRPINQSAINAIARRLNEQAGLANKYEPHVTEAELATAMDMDAAGAPLFKQAGKDNSIKTDSRNSYDEARAERVQERRNSILKGLKGGDWLPRKHFVEKFGINKSTIDKDLRALREDGLIEREKRREGAHATVSYYRAATP